MSDRPSKKRYQSRLCWLAITILLWQPVPSLAAVGQLPIEDVTLRQDGSLCGQLFDGAGQGIAAVRVELRHGPQMWQAETDARGEFQFRQLRGGAYQLQVEGQSHQLRAWTHGTAPPHALEGVLLAPTQELVRGQRPVSPNTNQFFRVAKRRLANPWVFGGIVATAVAIPVAIHNADDDDPPPATP